VLLDANLQQYLRPDGDPPIVALNKGAESPRVAGMEALVRWEHPERGLVSPDQFIPIAEESGLIIPLGWWVMEEACRQAREWQERYPSDPPLEVCVNLSAKQFLHPELSQDVAQILQKTGLEAEMLTLEITESVLLEDVQSNVATLERLKGLGVQLAIDDFGMGYSSLSYLRRLPVNHLKIDQSFIAGLSRNSGDRLIVSGVINLAHGLGLKVVAEGVETAEQLALLQEMACDLAQGNYFSEPLPGEAAERLLAGGVFREAL
jgi:EAL domain-containing protein (putative c-di-GMP-specific phosphodiesterase class I)